LKSAELVLSISLLLLFNDSVRGQVNAPTPRHGTCPTSESELLPVWRVRGTEPHGTHEFQRNTLLIVSPNVSTIVAEMWGGGGGGGGGGHESISEGGRGGSGGGSGSYIRTSFAVESNKTYTIVIGQGGHGGRPGMSGLAGGASAICDGDTAIVVAPGGFGGASARHGRESGGKGGPRSLTDSGLQRPGNDGRPGVDPLFEFGGSGGIGGTPVAGTITPSGSFGGNGGAGETGPAPAGFGLAGGHGTIVINW
jgi:hypothetical protein